jgi:hypothetical protein
MQNQPYNDCQVVKKIKILLKKCIKLIIPYGGIILFRMIKNKTKNKNWKLLKTIYFFPRVTTKNGQFIVTLTSYGKRLKTKAPYTIASLMRQDVSPDRIVLWLEYGVTLPNEIKKLEKNGLEIKYCKDIKSYKKLIPAILEFPENILITADDDAYYPASWFGLLKNAYCKNPKKIYCHRAHEIILDGDKNIIPYNEWRQAVRTIENNKRIFPTGIGGILYPNGGRGILHENVVNEEEFTELCPTADDIWFWAMAKLTKTEYEIVENGVRSFAEIGDSSDGLNNINVMECKNDEQIRKVIKRYPEIMDRII